MANISVTGGTLVSDIPVQKERQKVVETISAVNENNVSVKRGTLAMKRVREMVDVIQGGIEAMNQPKTEPEPEKTPFDPDREFSQSFRTDVTPPPEAQTTQVSGMAAPQAGQAATPPQPISSPQFKTTESPSISRPEAEERPTIGQLPPIQERPEVEVTELPDTTAASGVQPTDGKVDIPQVSEESTQSNNVDAIEASKAEVREVQKLLGVTADGILGPNTKRVMASFQYRVGLPVSGNIDTATMQALKNPDSGDPRNVKDSMAVLNEAGDAPDMTKVKEWAKETIADPLKAAAFVATVEAETGERDLVETGYDKKRAIEVFVDRNALPDGTLGPKMTARKAAIEALPSNYSADDIFDIVYGNRLGNDQPNDGSKYKGRGLIMITGKDNYKKVGEIIGVDLVENPELVNDPKYAAPAAMAYLTLEGKDFFSKDVTQDSLAKTVGHSDDKNNTEAAARFNRAKQLKEEMYP